MATTFTPILRELGLSIYRLDSMDIELFQQMRGKKLFTVRYGKEYDVQLGYSAATEKLGEAILHALCCESKADNSGEY